ncbi:group III truncated hemoglobin [Hephaestia sp. MAHUQ-44]|uniref:group III truncated hemoglobin n=1 Tax=Hephaestia sp. MAHUQ-44 TaxID=2952526 RepID=UPI00207765E9|nr:group III truncated hemoglobin [Hephaestia sp. MAHUQ-44]
MDDILDGLDDDGLKSVVHNFYGRVRDDAELGPVFDDAISDWPHHLGKMVDFWSSVMLTTGRYKGNPMMMHLKHKRRITPELFDRWLALWAETTNELMPPPVAAALQAKAGRIAESLQLGLFFRLDPHPSSPAMA